MPGLVPGIFVSRPRHRAVAECWGLLQCGKSASVWYRPHRGYPHEDRRRAQDGDFHAADQPFLSAGSLPLLRPRIFHHHLPHRSGGAGEGGARAAQDHRAAGEVRVHPHAGFDRLRRLYRDRAGDPRHLQRQGRRLCAFHVSRRRCADRRRPRDLGLPEEARQAEDRRRERRAGGEPVLWQRALRLRHHGLQAPQGRPRRRC